MRTTGVRAAYMGHPVPRNDGKLFSSFVFEQFVGYFILLRPMYVAVRYMPRVLESTEYSLV